MRILRQTVCKAAVVDGADREVCYVIDDCVLCDSSGLSLELSATHRAFPMFYREGAELSG